ncbi:2Fe-2S iron-sulfur cluster binding domain-containing protein [Aquimarina sp. U1-2]|uniref:2Fe-2S iron-sulfur cluster-binding protein n=1 Tax=Aquimarina sp. U1-2 TaxID=2823141 RepID=UPI001AEC8368|nr:2Fe-2S iron-sulfur cluster-binding protein [Aquimarina sp. U1-2]MBP2831069.1 2Fe-2S iron-sulfur cluster binding domain-containing protein [Aquimarina sp. U1-2]
MERSNAKITYITQVLNRGYTVVKTSIAISLLFLFSHGLRELWIWYLNRRKKAGKPIFVDKFVFAKKLPEDLKKKNHNKPIPAAPVVPHRFKARQMRKAEYPEPNYVLKYDEEPLPGKVLSGMGETEFRPVKKFYHNGYSHTYGAMELLFVMSTPKKALRSVLKASWYNNFKNGAVSLRKVEIDDPSFYSKEIKRIGIEAGASAIGCTKVTKEAVYEGVEDYLPNAVSLAAPMDRETMLTIPSNDSGAAIIEGYVDVGKAANKVAKYIRSLGYNAEANTNLMNATTKVLHIPIAVNAGLGQMGRHTSLITREHGANVRLATVLTDMPLEYDKPQDIGVEDVCVNCRICVENCPPQAIYPEKQMVRGTEKYHLDFDRCMPYFNEKDTCGICITVCPWSETNNGNLLSQLQMHRKAVKKSYPELLPSEKRLVRKSNKQQFYIDTKKEKIEDYWQAVKVKRIKKFKGDIIGLELTARDESVVLPRWAAGAHTEIKLPSGKIRAYSLSNPSGDHNDYRFGIKAEQKGNGGSLEIATLQVGDVLQVNRPGNNFPLRIHHDFYYLVAGGIGITPLVPMAHKLAELNKSFAVHYAVKKENKDLYADELRSLAGDNLFIHNERGWIKTAFTDAPENSAIYTCGPSSLMDDVKAAGENCGINVNSIYSEDFGSTIDDKKFNIVLASSGEKIPVLPGETITRALDRHGIFTPVSCGYGICGVCTVDVLEGEPDARDRILTSEDKHMKITLCCSRSKTKDLTIDL